MLPVDESLKSTHGCRVIQREHILCFDGFRALIGVFLEDDDLERDDRHAPHIRPPS